MSEIIEVGKYLAVSGQGAWSTHQGSLMLAWGSQNLLPWDQWAAENDWAYDFTLYYGSGGTYVLTRRNDGATWSGQILTVYTRPGGVVGMELQ